MNKTLIATVGIGKKSKENKRGWEETKVYLNGELIGEEANCIIPLAIKKGYEKIILVGIESPETLTEMERVESILKDVEIKKVIINNEKNKIKDAFNKMINIKEEEFDIDITHAYRDISVSVLIAFLLKEVLENKRVDIYYGQLINGENKRVEYLKYNEYSEFFNISFKFINAVKRLNYIEIEELINEIKKYYGDIIKEKGKNNKIIEERDKIIDILSKLRNILLNLNLGNVHDNFLQYIDKWINEEIIIKDPKIELLKNSLKKEIEEIYELLKDKEIYKRQIELGKLILHRTGNLQLSFALLREAWVSKMSEKPYIKEDREKAEDILKTPEKEKKGTAFIGYAGIRNALEHPLVDNEKYENIKGIFDEEEKIIRYVDNKLWSKVKKFEEMIENENK